MRSSWGVFELALISGLAIAPLFREITHISFIEYLCGRLAVRLQRTFEIHRFHWNIDRNRGDCYNEEFIALVIRQFVRKYYFLQMRYKLLHPSEYLLDFDSVSPTHTLMQHYCSHDWLMPLYKLNPNLFDEAADVMHFTLYHRRPFRC